jgi:hypothetical protein
VNGGDHPEWTFKCAGRSHTVATRLGFHQVPINIPFELIAICQQSHGLTNIKPETLLQLVVVPMCVQRANAARKPCIETVQIHVPGTRVAEAIAWAGDNCIIQQLEI